jgi:hypothetical protein
MSPTTSLNTEDKSLPLLGIKLQYPSCPAHSLTTVLIKVFRLHMAEDKIQIVVKQKKKKNVLNLLCGN